MRRMLIVLAAMMLAGCRYHVDPVPLRGDPSELRYMSGRWTGFYVGNESRRSGPITFEITANADSAYGEVLMVDAEHPTVPQLLDPRDVHLLHATSTLALNIQFVRISGDRVRGTLEPYRSPDCRCVTHTSFTGRIVADTISGTFLSLLEDDRAQQGTWRVVRRH